MYKAVVSMLKLKMLEAGVYRPYQFKPFPPNAGLYLLNQMHDNNKGDASFTVYMKYHCKGAHSAMCDKTADDLIEKAQVATAKTEESLASGIQAHSRGNRSLK